MRIPLSTLSPTLRAGLLTSAYVAGIHPGEGAGVGGGECQEAAEDRGGGARRARGGASHRVCLGLSAVPFHLLLFDDQRVVVHVVICVVGSNAGMRFEVEESAGALVSSSAVGGAR